MATGYMRIAFDDLSSMSSLDEKKQVRKTLRCTATQCQPTSSLEVVPGNHWAYSDLFHLFASVSKEHTSLNTKKSITLLRGRHQETRNSSTGRSTCVKCTGRDASVFGQHPHQTGDLRLLESQCQHIEHASMLDCTRYYIGSLEPPA
jgi:hypothetical protein